MENYIEIYNSNKHNSKYTIDVYEKMEENSIIYLINIEKDDKKITSKLVNSNLCGMYVDLKFEDNTTLNFKRTDNKINFELEFRLDNQEYKKTGIIEQKLMDGYLNKDYRKFGLLYNITTMFFMNINHKLKPQFKHGPIKQDIVEYDNDFINSQNEIIKKYMNSVSNKNDEDEYDYDYNYDDQYEDKKEKCADKKKEDEDINLINIKNLNNVNVTYNNNFIVNYLNELMVI